MSWKSGLIKRTCRSTFRAETHGMIYAKETSDNIRAIITDMRGKFCREDWESKCAQEIANVWLTDCQSLHDYLINPVAAGSEDKRLEIDLESLREPLWEYPSGKPKDDLHDQQTDKPRWIDTSAMICDPLTKTGPTGFAERLRRTMTSGILTLRPSEKSQLRKIQQQRTRLNTIKANEQPSRGIRCAPDL